MLWVRKVAIPISSARSYSEIVRSSATETAVSTILGTGNCTSQLAVSDGGNTGILPTHVAVFRRGYWEARANHNLCQILTNRTDYVWYLCYPNKGHGKIKLR